MMVTCLCNPGVFNYPGYTTHSSSYYNSEATIRILKADEGSSRGRVIIGVKIECF